MTQPNLKEIKIISKPIKLKLFCRDPKDAYKHAIETGALDKNHSSVMSPGNYIYMNSLGYTDNFVNSHTGQFLYVERQGVQKPLPPEAFEEKK